MTRAILLATALFLTGCSHKSTPPATFPAVPRLPERVESPCPPALKVLEKTLGTLVGADINLSALYASCSEKHDAAVAAYNKARQDMEEASHGQ